MGNRLTALRNEGISEPYPPSWMDRFIGWIDHLPGPIWLFYLLAVITLAVVINAFFWIDGSMTVGSFDRVNTLFSISVFYWLALYQHLSGVGSRALRDFRPLIEVADSEFARLDYELTVLPRWLGWLAVPLGYGFAALAILGEPEPYGDIIPRTILPYLGDIAITGFLVSTFFALVIRSVRQLRMVRDLHSRATNINLLKLGPAHAFSSLTARTAIGGIALLIFGYLLDPSAFASTILDIIMIVLMLAFAIAVFVLPVIGMRDHLEAEKARALNETSDVLQTTRRTLHNKASRADFSDMGRMESAINALILDREYIGKISTWPWDTRTVRGFTSALLLPIFLWLVTRLLERFV